MGGKGKDYMYIGLLIISVLTILDLLRVVRTIKKEGFIRGSGDRCLFENMRWFLGKKRKNIKGNNNNNNNKRGKLGRLKVRRKVNPINV